MMDLKTINSTVVLHKHPCEIYNFWSSYLQNNTPSAVQQIGDPSCFNPTARNRHNFATRKGYTSREITYTERNNYLDDIHAINTSMEVRQSKPMKESYLEYPSAYTDTPQCQQHYNSFIACFTPVTGNHQPATLVAYISTNFCGNLAAASQILGHGAYLNDGIMLQLWATFLKICKQRNITHLIYSRWGDGTDGLKYWKYSVGLRPTILKESYQ